MLPRMKPQAVLFDMDGVLVRSEEVWFRLVEEAGRRFGSGPITREAFAPTFGQGTRADVEVFGLSCTPAELDDYYRRHFADHADATWVDPTAAEVLAALRAAGIRTAVVTNTMTELAIEVLDAAKLSAHLEVVACADQVPRAKPAPDVVLHALSRLQLPASQAWMVGDSRYDREAAGAAGVHFVGYGIEGDRRVASLQELVSLVR